MCIHGACMLAHASPLAGKTHSPAARGLRRPCTAHKAVPKAKNQNIMCAHLVPALQHPALVRQGDVTVTVPPADGRLHAFASDGDHRRAALHSHRAVAERGHVTVYVIVQVEGLGQGGRGAGPGNGIHVGSQHATPGRATYSSPSHLFGISGVPRLGPSSLPAPRSARSGSGSPCPHLPLGVALGLEVPGALKFVTEHQHLGATSTCSFWRHACIQRTFGNACMQARARMGASTCTHGCMGWVPNARSDERHLMQLVPLHVIICKAAAG